MRILLLAANRTEMSYSARAQLRGLTMARAVKAVLRREGLRGLYGGVGAVALGAG
jgi:hypothetical protein